MTAQTISDAEWQVMNAVWEGEPLTAQEVITQLEHQESWAPATIKTMLHRLVKKNVITYEAQNNKYVYRSRVSRNDCVKQAGRSFMERFFGGETAPLLAHFVKSSQLSSEEIAQLRKLLKEKEG